MNRCPQSSGGKGGSHPHRCERVTGVDSREGTRSPGRGQRGAQPTQMERTWSRQRGREKKQGRALKPGEQNLQARGVMYRALQKGLGKCWQSKVSTGQPRSWNKCHQRKKNTEIGSQWIMQGSTGHLILRDKAKLSLDKLPLRECDKQAITCHARRLAPLSKRGPRRFGDKQA